MAGNARSVCAAAAAATAATAAAAAGAVRVQRVQVLLQTGWPSPCPHHACEGCVFALALQEYAMQYTAIAPCARAYAHAQALQCEDVQFVQRRTAGAAVARRRIARRVVQTVYAARLRTRGATARRNAEPCRRRKHAAEGHIVREVIAAAAPPAPPALPTRHKETRARMCA